MWGSCVLSSSDGVLRLLGGGVLDVEEVKEEKEEDGEEVSRGSIEVATPVQSKTPLCTISPWTCIGAVLLLEDSVRAREVASVPPRNSPYSRRGRGGLFGVCCIAAYGERGVGGLG